MMVAAKDMPSAQRQINNEDDTNVVGVSCAEEIMVCPRGVCQQYIHSISQCEPDDTRTGHNFE